MEICISWTVHAPPTVSAKDAMTSLTRWRQACRDLPFGEVSGPIQFNAAEIMSRLDNRADPCRWFLIQACTYVAVDSLQIREQQAVASRNLNERFKKPR